LKSPDEFGENMSYRFVIPSLREIEESIYWKMIAKARQVEGALTLLGGDPDFDTPKHIKYALIDALENGKTHYPPTAGIPELRKALAEYNSKYGADWKPSEVVLTAGSALALYISLAGTLLPGDEVITFEPYYFTYSDLFNYLGIKKVSVPLIEEKGYRLDIEKLKDNVTPKTKMIIVCSPNNPTGTVFTKKELSGISDLATEHDLIVISDEVYNEFIWDGRKHSSIAAFPDMKERTIVVNSFSKTFAMTGWRLGYFIADEPIATRLARQPIGFRPSTFVQLAGLKAIKGPWEPVEEMAKEYDRRRQYFVSRLNKIDGIVCQKPEGAFYVFPNIRAIGKKSVDFCEGLLDEQKVAIVPGIIFGDSCQYNVRIPLVISVDYLSRCADAIENYVEQLR